MLMNAPMMTHNIMELNMNYKEAQVATAQFDKEHGSFFDRGSADSYYHRPRNPHRGGVGGMSGPRIEAKTEAEFEAYHAGYDFNEEYGDKKDWG
jgi:hypothetical protein